MTPPTRRLNFPLPPSLPRRRIYEVKWREDQVWGHLNMLDLDRDSVRRAVFKSVLPVVIVFRAQRSATRIDAAVSYPIARHVRGAANAYTATAETTSDAMEHFSIAEADLPAVVIHDVPGGGAWYRMRQRKLSVASFATMWRRFRAGELTPVRAAGEEKKAEL